jgi:DNA-binding LacI/PurR family transcriptional regulator
VPVVMVSCWADYADCVAVDDQAGIGAAVEHLVALGHERIGYVDQPSMEVTTRRGRAAAFERALERHGLPLRWRFDDGEDFVGVLRDGGPTALVAATDHIAVRLIERLEAAGLSVPADVSLVGFDGIPVGALARIALTTVAQPADDLARQAVALLLNRIDRGYEAPPEQRRLEPALVLRRSTAPPRRPASAAR